MKKFKIINITFLLLFFIGTYSNAQKNQSENNCKVLVPAITESYSGECKKGLAHGEGKAEGVDKYEGDFKKGYPHGKGLYVWENGNKYDGEWAKGERNGYGIYTIKLNKRDSIVEGYWSKGEYKGLYKYDYKVNKTYNVPRNKVQHISNDREDITIKFFTNNKPIMPININLYGNTGSSRNLVSFIKVQNIIFPYKGKLTYKMPNNFGTMTYDCIFEFEIFKKGAWIISIYH